MKNQLRKLIGSALSAAMVAGCITVPVMAEGVQWTEDAGTWKFDFGSADNVADGYIGVSADTEYSAAAGYGLLGLTNGFATSWLSDGFTMTQGYDLKLENGSRDTVNGADDDFVACTYDETVGNTGMTSPVRFAMKSDESTYYKVKVTIQRADLSKEANVSLFTERRHQHLLEEPVPEEGLVYECSVFVHNWYDKNSGEQHDSMLNVVALGENVAVSSIEVEKLEEHGKTLFVLTDSTGCEQSAAIPYFPLDHCQGVGSAMAKYLGSDWALVNEGQSGLSASASIRHFENCINDVQAGDVVWFEFGHNDDKVTGDPSTNGYLSTLENYYNQVTAKGADFVVVSPIERKMQSQYNADNGTWSYSLNHYAVAGKNFVDEKIAAGADNIAFVDVNGASTGFLESVSTEINEKYNYGWEAPSFYYYETDYTHPNDFGADNFAKLFVDGANDIIAKTEESDADNSVKVQAEVLSGLLSTQRTAEANRVPESIYGLGKVPNSAYPNDLTKVVYYDYPWLLKKVEWNEDGTAKSVTAAPVACSDETIPDLYSKGVIEIYKQDGSLKGKVTTDDFLDALNGEATLTFSDKSVSFDKEAGDTYKAYMIDSDIGAADNTVVSNTLTEKDNVDIDKFLIQGSAGIENKEDFSSYSGTLQVGDSLINTNGWSSAGSVLASLGQEDDKYFMSVSKENAGSSHYLFKDLSEAVSSGQFYFSFDIRYISGIISLEFTDGSNKPNNFPPLYMPIVIKNSGGDLGVYLSNDLVTNINANEWVTVQYTIDFDNGVETATVNGKTLQKDVPFLQQITKPSPAQFKTLAIVETTKSNDITYDITNIIAGTLKVDNPVQKTITVAVDEDSNGMGSVYVNEEGTQSLTVNRSTTVVAYAVPEAGYDFDCWEDENGNVVGYATAFDIRLFDDMNLKAVFKKQQQAEHDYLYHEDYRQMTNATIDWSKSNTTPTIENDSANEAIGNYVRIVPNSTSGNRSSFKAFPEEAQVSSGRYVLEFDTKMTPSADRPTSLAVTSAVSESTNGYYFTDFIFSLNMGKAASEIDINATAHENNDISQKVASTSGYTKGTWAHVTALMDFDAKTVELTITSLDGSTKYLEGTYEMVGNVSMLGSMQVTAGRGAAEVGIDNIELYAEETDTPEPDKDFVVGEPKLNSDNKVELEVSNGTDSAQDVQLVVASYEDGILKSISISEKQTVAAAGSEPTVVTLTSDAPATGEYKVMLWDSIATMKQLMNAVSDL